MKILVISLAGIGDTLMATPLIHELRANFPDATLDAVVMWKGAVDVLQGSPHINEVHQKDLVKLGVGPSVRFLSRLRAHHYDISINTHPQSRIHYRLVAAFIGARSRVTHEYDNYGWLDRRLVTASVKQDYSRHCIENNLNLLPLVGAKKMLPSHHYELFLADSERKTASSWLHQNDLEDRVKIGVHIGSGGTKNLRLRRWPLENYIDLIRRLTDAQPHLAILLFGGPDEQEEHARILELFADRPVFVPPTKSLREAAAIIASCRVFLSVDTALMHVAAAMQVPQQLVIETPTLNPTVVPYRKDFKIIPNPAVAGKTLNYYRYDGGGIRGTVEELAACMKSVTVEKVFEAILKSMA